MTDPTDRDRHWPLVLAGVAVVAPLLAALVALRQPRWLPVLDLAQTELRVRDVGGRHSPLVGLAGRIGTAEHQGSHPGPASFYALAPTYRLLGASAWALQAASVVIHMVAVGVAMWFGRRRGGTILSVGVGLAAALLIVGYGSSPMTEPWNPYLPLLWWLVFLLGVWSALCGDHRVLWVTVAAGSFSAQTHVPYLGLCVALGGLAAGASLWHLWRAAAVDRRRRLRWLGLALGVGVLMWLPPTIDQVRHEPGNYSLLIDSFATPSVDTLGPEVAMRLVAERLDVAFLVVEVPRNPGALIQTTPGGGVPSQTRGSVALAVWVASAVAAVGLKHRALLALHAVVGVGLLLAAAVLSRVFGFIWFYLMTWVWGLGALMAIATAWTLVVLVARRTPPPWLGLARRTGVGVLAGWLAVTSIQGVRAAPDAEQSDYELSAILSDLVPDVVRALEAEVPPATGRGGRYLVSWSDSVHIGSQGYGLLNELERRGYDVGVVDAVAVVGTRHRVRPRSEATARITLATGVLVERWRAVEGVSEVATTDPRSASQRREFDRLRRQVLTGLDEADLPILAARLDEHLFEVATDVRLPASLQPAVTRMLDLGVETAVFVGPPDAEPTERGG